VPESIGKDFQTGKALASFAGDKIGNFFGGVGGGQKNESVITLNVNDKNGVIGSVETQSFGNYKQAINVGG